MMRCIVVDDDELSRSVIEDLINETDSLELIKSCEDAVEAFKVIKEEHIDLVFLDIEMPKMDGLEMLRTLSPLPQVILVTAHEKYAVESYEYDVTDFLHKPISLARFMKAVDKAYNRFENNRADITSQDKTIFIKADSRLVQINTEDILYIEALGNYMRIFTTGEQKYTILSTMKDIISKLSSDDFVRVHRSFIVRLDKIKTIEDNYIVINNKQINIGKAYKDDLTQKLNLL
ncbi:Transcriptional regulatory protein YpdB [Parvicella tangerina]|uniref:Transcriptional regulatory protein YpdB n=2 Tax=Parvicella tangerina TaxID=2829795 RepID=A0A916JNU8_9FLAO|nr:Transcriptional regulatory protein YpdB [Parvicella tangerina]